MKVPSDLQPSLHAKWIKRSLKTSRRREAEILLNGLLTRIHTSFTLLRSGVLDQEQVAAIRSALIPGRNNTRKEKSPKSLRHLVELYVAESSPNWKRSTRVAFDQKLSVIVKGLGNRSVSSYRREDFLAFRNQLSDSGYQPKTVNCYISLLSSILKWGARHGYLERNHSEGLLLKITKAPDEQRKAYSREDVTNIISTLPNSSRCPWQRWVPLVAMYSGMRREEICQLRPCDVVEVDGVWRFRIQPDSQGGLTVKTEASSRLIPVHPVLLSQGFLGGITGNTPSDNLWGFKKYKGTGEYGKKFGNWYSTFNRQITDDLLKCFHSLRHTVADTLKQQGVQETLRKEGERKQ